MVQEVWLPSLLDSDKETINEFKQNYGKGTHDLLQMLKDTHKLLRENSKAWFPE